MTFDEFYQERIKQGLTDTIAVREACMAAWDTALCAASSRFFDHGKPCEIMAIHSSIQELHTWPPEPEPS